MTSNTVKIIFATSIFLNLPPRVCYTIPYIIAYKNAKCKGVIDIFLLFIL